MPAKPLEEEFRAWIDTMPGKPPQLIVTGKVEAPSSGWTFTLTEAHPLGINPAILILDLAGIAPGGPSPDVVSEEDVRFERSPPGKSNQVTIRGLGGQFTIDIGSTS